MLNQNLLWIIFGSIVVGMLIIDLGIINRGAREIKFKKSLFTSGMWILSAVVFNVIVFIVQGPDQALKFMTGYLIEESLSVDNLFVFIIIFSYFKVEARYQHRVLFWGILGAVIMRGFFIVVGITLIQMLHWTIYILGAFLVYTGIKLAFRGDGEQVDPEKNVVLKLVRRYLPVTEQYRETSFVVRENGKLLATPLLVVLILIETTDIVFAVDSIPAILAISKDPFIVYTSNIFAVLGLRALYFSLAGVMKYFHYLNYGLALILSFIGVKMLIEDFVHIPIEIALGIVAGVLLLSVIASIAFPRKKNK